MYQIDDSERRARRLRLVLGVAGLLVVATALLFVSLPAQAQPATPTRRPTRTPTLAATATLTATVTATPTSARVVLPSPTPRPLAFIILPAPSVKEGLVGDVVVPEGVALSASYPTLFGDRIALGMANLRDLDEGPASGSGIAFVTFRIFDLTGELVHESTTGAYDRFCAFGGSGDACAVHDLAASGYRWPGGAEARSGRYTLVAFAQGDELSHRGTWSLAFEVRLARDGLQETDGAARIRSVERDGDELVVTVESFGFTPFLHGTHLHLFFSPLSEEEATAGAAGVTAYPEEMGIPGAFAMARVRVPAPAAAVYGQEEICVAVVHPDGVPLPGRGECVDLP